MCVVMSADLNWVRSEISYVVSNCDTRSLCEKSQVCGSLVSVAQSPLASFPNTGAGEGYVRERAGDHRFVADSEWDWTLRVFDHVDLNTSDYTASARFYETVLSPLGIPKDRRARAGDLLHESQRRRQAATDEQPASLLLRQKQGAS
jgi:hypothetical protein